ncbi:MBL fold metallo-hydrolase [Pseudemcibacter aquimaris]|uniref:MBL fold metallo-hydrolase n=1 Tax=Pseudemcibacter aquimaris TaxID=2857064 RepID=UPI002011D939|nr:MBL fold metallo-hydrolase [Pseudemcibacter aquimaris]MCC3859948.1 MBL fold metallo-hydrolase [Pseudemcibacter aquimaris]WDU57280.1 MBL fold metallo-hydrolase [Pseudemcibacter aquimaris]
MKLTFLGATGTVTGSKYLLEYGGKKLLIDCGLFQGFKELRLRNRAGLPIDPADIDAVILTHAHIDHSGYVPLLVKNGFTGPIYASAATMDLCKILLPDSGYLQEEDARRANRYGYTRHSPAMPLYTQEDAEISLENFKPVDFGSPVYIQDDLHFTLSRAGHILGASFISLKAGNKTITFSGDLGRAGDALMHDPAALNNTDYLLIESTYGDRLHAETDPAEKFGEVIRKTAARGGTVLIPTFAVGRAQTILYHLKKLTEAKKIPAIPIFMDSPMALNATNLMCRHKSEHRLSESYCADVCNIAAYTRTREDSKALNANSMPKVIISASGMLTGGRVLHHLKDLMGDPKNTVLFTGFQAGGTRGEAMLDGEDMIKIHGHMHKVRADVELVENLSAHADKDEIITWLKNFRKAPAKTFITHGEPSSSAALRKAIIDELGWNAKDLIIPEYEQVEML